MSSRFELANVACPASTPANTPVEVPFTWKTGIVRRISIVIPDGHSGLTGIALGYGHNPTLPTQALQYISGNDEVIVIAYDDHVPGVQWQAFVCNLDLQAHAWQIRFELDEAIGSGPVLPTVPIPTADILAAGATLLGGP